MSAGPQPRRQYIVYRHVQFYYFVVWLLGLLAAVLVCGMLYFFYHYKPTYLAGQRLDWNDLKLPYIFLVSILFLTIAMSMAMGLHAILTSHKIAGAAYRIRESLKRIRQQKDFEHVIQLREGDYLQEIADGVNGLTGDFQHVRKTKESILADIQELKRAAAEGKLDTGKATQLAGEIEKKLSAI